MSYSQSAFRDGYRTDCSGYVSMAWKTNRNYWTGDLNTIGTAIAYNDLRPGDMLLYHNPANPVNGSHVVLFDRWVSGVGGDFFIYEQTPPHTMHRRWSEAGYRRVLFKPYRYVNATEGGASLSGDARDDLVALDVNGEVRAFPNIDGMNFNWGTPRVVANGWLDPGRTVFADLDGDGRDDLIALDVNGEVRAFPNIDGMNFNWGTPRVVANGWLDPGRTVFADLDGDGRDDLIALDVNGEVRAFPNIDGMNFNWGEPRVVANGWTDPGRTVFADLNGDGRDDLIALDVNGEVRAFPNIDGMNFNWGEPRVVANGWTDPDRTVFADLDGDGRDDLIALDLNGEVRAFPNIDGMNFNWGTPRVVANGWLDPGRTVFA